MNFNQILFCWQYWTVNAGW